MAQFESGVDTRLVVQVLLHDGCELPKVVTAFQNAAEIRIRVYERLLDGDSVKSLANELSMTGSQHGAHHSAKHRNVRPADR